MLSNLSLATVSPFLSKVKDAPWFLFEVVYSVFTVETLHSFYLGTSNMLKEFFVIFVGSATWCTEEGRSV